MSVATLPTPRSAIFATGSEVEIALDAKELLEAKGISARVVSVPVDRTVRRSSPTPTRPRSSAMPRSRSPSKPVSAMAGTASSGNDGGFVGMNGFGASAPYKTLYEHFGITRRSGRREAVTVDSL